MARASRPHATQDVSEADIARDMVGREVFLTGRKGSRVRASGEPLISLDRVSMTNAAGRLLLAAVSFEVGAGEVFGIAGVDGNGQTELAEAIAGLANIAGGTISLHGRDVTGFPSPNVRTPVSALFRKIASTVD